MRAGSSVCRAVAEREEPGGCSAPSFIVLVLVLVLDYAWPVSPKLFLCPNMISNAAGYDPRAEAALVYVRRPAIEHEHDDEPST